MQKDVREGIEHDLRNVVKCRFDRLLKYFLYLVLKKDSEEKKKLDELQRKIEELQSERYHTYENVGREDKMSDDMPQEQPVDDSNNGTKEEKDLIRNRDDILDGLLKQTLDAVQPIVDDHDAKVKNLLKELWVSSFFGMHY